LPEMESTETVMFSARMIFSPDLRLRMSIATLLSEGSSSDQVKG
jgi:hypothetical protein